MLLEALRAVQGNSFNMAMFEVLFKEACDLLMLNPELCERGIHDGFSGGE
jgi:Fe-S cluster assembly ATPase SufC